MPGEGSVDEALVRAVLLEEYGIRAGDLGLLAGGLDRDAWTYRVRYDDGPDRTVRVCTAEPRVAAYHVPSRLRGLGVEAVVAPVPTRGGEPFVHRHGVTWSVYPFVDGTTGWTPGPTAAQWRRLGVAARAIHETALDAEVRDLVPRESFASSGYALAVERCDAAVASMPAGVGAVALRSAWLDTRPAVAPMLDQMSLLAGVLGSAPPRRVLCHGDLHPGNVLFTRDGVHVIDWDDVLFAPRERDFLFAPGLPSAAGVVSPFLRGYGITEDNIDWAALTYHRCERVVQDVVAFADEALDLVRRDEDPFEPVRWLRLIVGPGGEADTAVAAAQRLPAELTVLHQQPFSAASGDTRHADARRQH